MSEFFFSAERFKQVRDIKDLSQVDMANDLGISPATIVNIETGKNEPTVATLLKVCNRYGFHPRYFFVESVVSEQREG